MLKKYDVRTFIALSLEQIWETLEGRFIIVFDDGELEVNAKETIYSRYSWEFFRTYPDTPILKLHHVSQVLKGKRASANTHLLMLGNALWTVYDSYKNRPSPNLENPSELALLDPSWLLDNLAKMLYGVTNMIYNDMTIQLEEYVVSLDITDFADVYEHPEIRAANMSVVGTEESIAETYDIITRVLNTAPELSTNPIAQFVRSKLVNANQVLQCIGPRGFLTDVNSIVFKKPVLRSYYAGYETIYDSTIESRSSAKSLDSAKKQLQDTEYFSRRMQLITNIVERLHSGDCGSTKYTHWHMRPAYIEGNRQIRPADHKLFAGKYYADEKGELHLISADDEQLVGKTLKIRTIHNCQHPDPHGVCATCYGQMSEAIPPGTNLGQINSTTVMAVLVQLVLSTKHFDGSSTVESLSVLPAHQKFLRANVSVSCYHMAEFLKGKKVFLTISADAASNISDIFSVESVEDLHPQRVSEITEIKMEYVDGRVSKDAFIPVSLGRRHASLTYPMLEYIKKNKWNLDADGNYVFDLTDFDFSLPILQLPLRHVNMSDHAKAIEELLESNVKQAHTRDKLLSPDAFLVELFDLVNERMEVNIAIIEVVMYGEMIVSAEDGDFDIPKPSTKRSIGVMSTTFINRSLSAAMAYQGQRDLFLNPMSYSPKARPDHPFDALLMPAEVFAHNNVR